MSHRRTAALTAAVAALAAAAAAAPSAEAAEPAYRISGQIRTVASITTDCPAVPSPGRVKETVRWTWTYQVSGSGRRGSGGIVKYASTRKLFKQVEVFGNDYISPFTYDGPVEKWGDRSTPWGTVVSTDRKGRVRADLNGFSDSEQVLSPTRRLRKGQSRRVYIHDRNPKPIKSDNPDCTATDSLETYGSITFTRIG